MIKERLDSVTALRGRVASVPEHSVKDTLREIRRRLPGGEAPSLSLVSAFDASDAEKPEILAWFDSLKLPADTVQVYWPYDAEGVSMALKDFFQTYDDLWFPSADDVWVIGPGGRYLLELHHEERFSLWE
jgi:hypothetical protein